MKIAATFAALASVFAAGSLAQSTCNQWSPCYREGYCDSNAMFCLWGLCDQAKSFNATACWKPEGCSSQTIDFSSSADSIPIKSYTGDANKNAFLSIFEPNHASVNNGNLVLQMPYDAAQKKGFGATVDASHTIQYGKVTARIKTASIAKGVVSSFIIRNDQTGDEIDFEFVGLSPNQVQTNYYFNNVLDYTKMVPYELGASTAADFHDYTIDWSKDAIVWSVDGKVIRTVKKADTFDAKKNVYAFPTSEARVALSIWDGGNAAGEGTRQWAGFPTPFDGNKVYEMYVDSVKIECNGGSTAPQSSATASANPTSSAVYSASSAAPAPGQTSVHKCIPRPSAY